MSLRQDLIEAGAKRLHDVRTPEFDVDAIPWEQCHDLYRDDLRNVAMVSLDAMLDLLTERADEIAREAGDTFIDWQKVAPTDQWQRIVKNLAAVLRNPGSSGGE